MWTTLVLSDVMILERDWILHEKLTYVKGTGGMSKLEDGMECCVVLSSQCVQLLPPQVDTLPWSIEG